MSTHCLNPALSNEFSGTLGVSSATLFKELASDLIGLTSPTDVVAPVIAADDAASLTLLFSRRAASLSFGSTADVAIVTSLSSLTCAYRVTISQHEMTNKVDMKEFMLEGNRIFFEIMDERTKWILTLFTKTPCKGLHTK